VTRLRLAWACHELRRASEYERHHLAQAIAWGEERRRWLARVNELTAPVVVEQPAALRVVER
jgi:hypothetical protein